MGNEINLLKNYPQTKRDISERQLVKNETDKAIARQFGRDFFDGERKYGYGGFQYHSRFWENVVPTFQEYYNLGARNSVLDVGCAKGFMLYDFQRLIPGLEIKGVDISRYAIENSKVEVKEYLQVADAKKLPFTDNFFDLAISITTLHNLPKEECVHSLLELQRVSKRCFVTLDAFRNIEDEERMHAWNLTAQTYMHVEDWKKLFKQISFNGDYYWFIP